MILDCCSDNTEIFLTNFIDSLDKCDRENKSLLTNILILKSETPLFETTSDNLGFFCSRGKYIIEIQADMKMTDYGYNIKLLKPFTINDDIISISGRFCCEQKTWIGIGKSGKLIETETKDIPSIDMNRYYIGETCNRGPLVLDNNKLRELKYLDEVNYFLDDSDHDLFARAYVEKKWRCGYVPLISFHIYLMDLPENQEIKLIVYIMIKNYNRLIMEIMDF